MSDEDREYFYHRAEEEIARAQASSDERVVKLHYELAGFYLDKVYGEGVGSRPRGPLPWNPAGD